MCVLEGRIIRADLIHFIVSCANMLIFHVYVRAPVSMYIHTLVLDCELIVMLYSMTGKQLHVELPAAHVLSG